MTAIVTRSWFAALAAVLLVAPSPAAQRPEGASLEGVVRCTSDQPKVVFVEGDDLQRPAPPSQAAVLDQRGLVFVPHVLPVMVGTRVAFINSDPLLHNVFSASKVKLFNLGTYPTGVTRYVTFDRPGMVEVLCNVHHEMLAYILVLPTHLFTTTDSNGRYRLDGLPPGKTRVTLWCEVHGVFQKEWVIADSGIGELDWDDSGEPETRELVFER